MTNPTEGVPPDRVRLPFVRRNVADAEAAQQRQQRLKKARKNSADDADTTMEDDDQYDSSGNGYTGDSDIPEYEFLCKDEDLKPGQRATIVAGLEIRVCMESYKMFFKDGTEDIFARSFASRIARAYYKAGGDGEGEKLESELKWRNMRNRKWQTWLENRQQEIKEEEEEQESQNDTTDTVGNEKEKKYEEEKKEKTSTTTTTTTTTKIKANSPEESESKNNNDEEQKMEMETEEQLKDDSMPASAGSTTAKNFVPDSSTDETPVTNANTTTTSNENIKDEEMTTDS